MALKIDTKFEGKLACASKNDLRDLADFHKSTFESLKIGTFIRSFCPKYKIYELKIYRGVMCHDNEQWFKIWTGIDLSIQNWHEEYNEFDPSTQKSQKCAL